MPLTSLSVQNINWTWRRHLPVTTKWHVCVDKSSDSIIIKWWTSSPIKSCTLDPVPTFLVREHVDLLLAYMTTMINFSLRQGRQPDSQKHALVTPLLKKTSLDNPIWPIFGQCPIFRLCLRWLRRSSVSRQLNEHLTDQGLLRVTTFSRQTALRYRLTAHRQLSSPLVDHFKHWSLVLEQRRGNTSLVAGKCRTTSATTTRNLQVQVHKPEFNLILLVAYIPFKHGV